MELAQVSGSQPGAILSPRNMAISGDIYGCYNLEQGLFLAFVDKDQGFCLSLYNAQGTPPTTKNYLPLNINSAEKQHRQLEESGLISLGSESLTIGLKRPKWPSRLDISREPSPHHLVPQSRLIIPPKLIHFQCFLKNLSSSCPSPDLTSALHRVAFVFYLGYYNDLSLGLSSSTLSPHQEALENFWRTAGEVLTKKVNLTKSLDA